MVSPDDVRDERDIVRSVCNEIDDDSSNEIDVEIVSWDYGAQNIHKDAQANVNAQMKPSEADMVIVIVWQRLGSKIGNSYIGKITGQTDITGTQWEIEDALSNKDMPTYFYFKTTNKMYSLEESKEAVYQDEILNQFLSDMNIVKNDPKNGHQEFKNLEEFEEKIRNLLKIQIKSLFGKRINTRQKKVQHKNIPSFIKILSFILVVALMLIYLYVSGTRNSDENISKMQNKKTNIHVVTKSNNRIFITMRTNINTPIGKQTYNYFLGILTKEGVEVYTDISKSTFNVELNQSINNTNYIVSEIEMVKAECILSYTVIDIKKHRTISSETQKNEAIGFQSGIANSKCLSALYGQMSKSLIKTIKEI